MTREDGRCRWTPGSVQCSQKWSAVYVFNIVAHLKHKHTTVSSNQEKQTNTVRRCSPSCPYFPTTQCFSVWRFVRKTLPLTPSCSSCHGSELLPGVRGLCLRYSSLDLLKMACEKRSSSSFTFSFSSPAIRTALELSRKYPQSDFTPHIANNSTGSYIMCLRVKYRSLTYPVVPPHLLSNAIRHSTSNSSTLSLVRWFLSSTCLFLYYTNPWLPEDKQPFNVPGYQGIMEFSLRGRRRRQTELTSDLKIIAAA